MSTSNDDGDRNRPKGSESGHAGSSPGQSESVLNNRGSDQNQHSTPPAPLPQPTMGYPPVTGYPPPGPGGHPPPGSYPPNYNPYSYPHATGYYPSPYQHPPHAHMQPHGLLGPSPLEGFIRGAITAIMMVIIISCIFSIVTYILFRPVLPEYHVTSFSVTNFNISNGVLAGNWDANVLVHNPNRNRKATFDRIKAYVYHGNIVNYLSWSPIQLMSLDTNSTSSIHVINTMANQVQPPDWIVTAISEEREGGSVKFEMALSMLAAFKSEMGWMSHLSLTVFCEGLRVKFPSLTAGSGSVSPSDLPRKCITVA